MLLCALCTISLPREAIVVYTTGEGDCHCNVLIGGKCTVLKRMEEDTGYTTWVRGDKPSET